MWGDGPTPGWTSVVLTETPPGILQKPSVPCTICGYGSILICIYKFTTFFHALSCMYFNVCVPCEGRLSLFFKEVLICVLTIIIMFISAIST